MWALWDVATWKNFHMASTWVSNIQIHPWVLIVLPFSWGEILWRVLAADQSSPSSTSKVWRVITYDWRDGTAVFQQWTPFLSLFLPLLKRSPSAILSGHGSVSYNSSIAYSHIISPPQFETQVSEYAVSLLWATAYHCCAWGELAQHFLRQAAAWKVHLNLFCVNRSSGDRFVSNPHVLILCHQWLAFWKNS